jgi:hypothetical protein
VKRVGGRDKYALVGAEAKLNVLWPETSSEMGIATPSDCSAIYVKGRSSSKEEGFIAWEDRHICGLPLT